MSVNGERDLVTFAGAKTRALYEDMLDDIGCPVSLVPKHSSSSLS